MALLSVRELSVAVSSPDGLLPILDRVSFDLERRSVTALVGESGSGKTLTALAIMSLLPEGARVTSGAITFEGRQLLELGEPELCQVRGARIGFVFQEPSAALNPVLNVGSQLLEAITLHQRLSKRAALAQAEGWLAKLGLVDPKRVLSAYPHELSGGMKQRVLLAIALAAGPALLIADEPTAALDRTLEAEVIERIMLERDERDMSVLLVSHDLARVAEVADHIVVMYAGQVVESGPALSVVTEPAHPYTQGLMASIPDPSCYPPREIGGLPRKLPVLPGSPPSFSQTFSGCRFVDRCSVAEEECREQAPVLVSLDEERAARCLLLGRARGTNA